MRFKFCLLTFFFAISAQAIGILTVKGKIQSFDQNTFTLKLSDGKSAKLAKNLLSPSEQENLRPDTEISLDVDERTLKKSYVKSKK